MRIGCSGNGTVEKALCGFYCEAFRIDVIFFSVLINKLDRWRFFWDRDQLASRAQEVALRFLQGDGVEGQCGQHDSTGFVPFGRWASVRSRKTKPSQLRK